MELYDLKQVCDILKMSLRGVRDLIKDGKLKASKVGTHYMVTNDAIKDYLKATEIKPKD
jgi:excisionase family DNA binding protein